jgi:hypothetical protein
MDELSAWPLPLDVRADGPFGDVASVSGRALQRFSFAARQAAENLLHKARRALDRSDLDRAGALVERATRLPFDDHEQAWPAALAVHMDLFCAVTDALENAPEDDSRWLEAAVIVLARVDERAACDLRDVLVAIDHDYAIKPGEHRRIDSAIASVPKRAELRDLELTAPQLCEHVMSVLNARRAYDQVLAALPA